MTSPSLARSRAGLNGGVPSRWLKSGLRRATQYGYAVAISALAVVTIVALPGTAPSSEAMYLPLAVAIAIGLLMTVRLAPQRHSAALVLLPAMAMNARFGLAALPALVYLAVVVNLVRGMRGPRVLSTASHLVLAFAAGFACAQIVPAVFAWITFAVVFSVVRLTLWYVAARLDISPDPARNEKPELLLSLALAPVGWLPLAAGERLGDGALLLALAALLALLFVVREAANLATARGEMEAERDRLARANALQDDMIDLITHELRNPLTLVISYAQMARLAARDENYEAIPAYINNVERAGQSIQRLMENLLQLSKLERSDSLPESAPIQVTSIISQVVADLAPLARQKHQTLKIESTGDLEPELEMTLLLREALSNLISNALKYTPEGGEIGVWAERGHEPHTFVLGVRDTGIGLTTEDQARLFTKFFRSSDPRVQRERGTGLGLALTHALVTRLGGKISVESQPGAGTTFRLTLPTGAV